MVTALPRPRSCLAAAVLGVLFTFITLRLTLGSAGLTPPLTIPAGLLSYVLLKLLAKVTPNSAALTAQENAVAQTMATSCFKIVGFAGYGSYLTALSYPIYLQLGGVPRDQPGFDPDVVVEPTLSKVYPYLLCIAFGGIFVLLGLRVMLIIKWRLPFPSGAASGNMINSLNYAQLAATAASPAAPALLPEVGPAPAEQKVSLEEQECGAHQGYDCNRCPHEHSRAAAAAAAADDLPAGGPLGTAVSSPSAAAGSSDTSSSDGSSAAAVLATRKVKVLLYTALGSFLFDAFKWLFQGTSYGCGFASWPTFGLAAAKWTWRFDFQQQYIGSGFLVPHIVAWSMLLGAVISWGIMWPLLSVREGDWYPSGLSPSDMRGLAGYKIFLSVSLLLGEGAFIMAKAALLGYRHLQSRRAQQHTRHRSKHGIHHSSSRAVLMQHEDRSGSGTQGDLHPCCTSSTSFCARPSLEGRGEKTSGSAGQEGDVRLRVGPTHDLQQQQRQRQQPGQLHHSQYQQEQEQHVMGSHSCRYCQPRQQGQQLSGKLDASVDGHAVLCDCNPSNAMHKDVDCAINSSSAPGLSGRSSECGIRWRGGAASSKHPASQDEAGVAGATFKETAEETIARERVFLADSIPTWVGPAGYCLCVVLGAACIPLVYPPARWYMVLVAFLVGPPVALANGFGTGLTDVDNSANYSTVAMFAFAAWAASTGGNGVVAGCVISGVLMVFSVSAAVLLQDLRTGYMTLTPPSSMLTAQVLGAAFGVLFSPLAFALFWSTGQVGVADGPYPAPFASVTRGMASIGVLGFSALPRHCVLLSGLFFFTAVVICTVRELLPVRFGRFVPSPMGMAFPFFIPASNAIDFWVGSLIVMIWEWRAPVSAEHYAPLAGAGLLVGDGLWAIPSAILAIANVTPPMCMKFE